MQEKYEEAMTSIAEMEKRVVMAESMLEATLQYQSGQLKAQPSPRFVFRLLMQKSFSCLIARTWICVFYLFIYFLFSF